MKTRLNRATLACSLIKTAHGAVHGIRRVMPDEPACIRAFRAAHDSAGARGVDGGPRSGNDHGVRQERDRREQREHDLTARDLEPMRGRRARETNDFEKKGEPHSRLRPTSNSVKGELLRLCHNCRQVHARLVDIGTHRPAEPAFHGGWLKGSIIDRSRDEWVFH